MRKKWMFLLIAVLIIFVSGIGFGFWYHGQQPAASMGGGIRLEADAQDWNKELDNASGDAEGIKIPGYGEISIAAGTDTMQMALVNPEDNPCYFQFTLTVDDNGEEKNLYESGLVEPGKAVKEFAIENLPSAGDYDMLIKIHTYSLENAETSMNGAEVATILHVVG